VVILPYIDDPEAMILFQVYDKNEPWDGPNNIRLVERMPKCYAMPGLDKKPSIAVAGFEFVATKLNALPKAGEKTTTPPGHTYYRVFVSKHTVRAKAAFTRGIEMTSGAFDHPSRTILVVEAAEAVPWTKPDDLKFDPNQPLPKLGGHFPGVFNAVLASMEVKSFPIDMPETELRGWITRTTDPHR
jgi:hypothetical protein